MLQKYLGILILVQTFFVLVLLVKVNSFETRLDEIRKGAKAVQVDTTAVNQSASSDLAATPSTLDGSQVRSIIREELRGIARSNELLVQTNEPVSEPPVFDEVEMQYRRQLVIEEMDLLRQQEAVSGTEMEELLANIASLNPESRTEMLRELTRSIDRGEINGRF